MGYIEVIRRARGHGRTEPPSGDEARIAAVEGRGQQLKNSKSEQQIPVGRAVRVRYFVWAQGRPDLIPHETRAVPRE